MRKSILITGVAGLIGSRMADWIIENHPEYEVVGIDNLFGGYIENVNKKVVFYKNEEDYTGKGTAKVKASDVIRYECENDVRIVQLLRRYC